MMLIILTSFIFEGYIGCFRDDVRDRAFSNIGSPPYKPSNATPVNCILGCNNNKYR